jgi:hypothetical protein
MVSTVVVFDFFTPLIKQRHRVCDVSSPYKHIRMQISKERFRALRAAPLRGELLCISRYWKNQGIMQCHLPII